MSNPWIAGHYAVGATAPSIDVVVVVAPADTSVTVSRRPDNSKRLTIMAGKHQKLRVNGVEQP